MHNQFCKNCGQANFPDANNCTKCGNPLAPTAAVDQQASKPNPVAEKSNKKYWIAGIVGVLLLSFLGLIGIGAIGAIFYFSTKDEVVREYPAPEKKPAEDEPLEDDDSPLSDIKFPPTGGSDELKKETGNSKLTDEVLISFFKNLKPKVGKYRLRDVVAIKGTSKFPSRNAGATARYRSGSKRVTHEVGLYEAIGDAKDDFASYKRFVKRTGGKIKTNKKTSIVYIKGPLVYLAFYNQQGGFHIMSSRNGKDILKYHNDYFGTDK